MKQLFNKNSLEKLEANLIDCDPIAVGETLALYLSATQLSQSSFTSLTLRVRDSHAVDFDEAFSRRSLKLN